MTPPAEFSMQVPGAAEYASTARLFAAAIARQLECSEETVEDLKLALSEAFAFATRNPARRSPLHVSITVDSGELVVDVEHASGFDAMLGRDGSSDPAIEFGVAVIESLFPDARATRTPRGGSIRFRLPLGA